MNLLLLNLLIALMGDTYSAIKEQVAARGQGQGLSREKSSDKVTK